MHLHHVSLLWQSQLLTCIIDTLNMNSWNTKYPTLTNSSWIRMFASDPSSGFKRGRELHGPWATCPRSSAFKNCNPPTGNSSPCSYIVLVRTQEVSDTMQQTTVASINYAKRNWAAPHLVNWSIGKQIASIVKLLPALLLHALIPAASLALWL